MITELSSAGKVAEAYRCIKSYEYFCDNYLHVLRDRQGETGGEWVKFNLWPAQRPVARFMQTAQRLIALKSRQVGLSWLGVGRCLHQNMAQPNSMALLYSLRDEEAQELLTRAMGQWEKLPEWLRSPVTDRNKHYVRFANGSRFRALNTNSGDSYTASIVMIDEAAIVPNLNEILRRVKPTIDNGGQLFLISRANKDRPNSTFNRIYQASKTGENDYQSVFLPWADQPERTPEWYETQKRDSLSRTGALDDLYEAYPATDIEALAARESSKRIPQNWVSQSYEPLPEQGDTGHAGIHGVKIYAVPEIEGKYIFGIDVAEGKETSDDSAIVVLNRRNGAQVAEFHGQIEISVFSELIIELSRHYNRAKVLVERNNHGHAVIERLADAKVQLLHGRDGHRGHLSDARGKAEMYSTLAEALRDKTTIIRSPVAMYQILDIERATLRASENNLDDVADAYAIATVGYSHVPATRGEFGLV